MKRLFLSSSFKEVLGLFKDFANNDFNGKTVTFIPTASIPETIKFYVGAGMKALKKLGLQIDELEISNSGKEEIARKLRGNDYIYVSGGNTFYLLQELKKTGADLLITEQINQGKLYIGESAGSMILAPHIEYVKDMDNCKAAPALSNFEALNLVDFYPLPHHTNFPFKKAVEKIMAKYHSELNLYPISNSQVIMVNGEIVKIGNT